MNQDSEQELYHKKCPADLYPAIGQRDPVLAGGVGPVTGHLVGEVVTLGRVLHRVPEVEHLILIIIIIIMGTDVVK